MPPLISWSGHISVCVEPLICQVQWNVGGMTFRLPSSVPMGGTIKKRSGQVIMCKDIACPECLTGMDGVQLIVMSSEVSMTLVALGDMS